ncbi:MAG TPA: mechanosensitive ion channel family protein [Bacteroidota bacterium]|nr:mechanosensitive ion channel family protein [Bacteroidota bacterium]
MKSFLVVISDTLLKKLEAVFGTGLLFHTVAGFILFLLILILGKGIKFFLESIGRRIFTFTKTAIDDEILEIILERVMSISAILGMYFGLRELSEGLDAGNTSFLKFLEYSNAALYVLMAVVLTTLGVKVADTLIRHALHSVAEKESSNFDLAFAPLVNRFVNIIVGVIAVIIVLDHFGQNISSLLALLSVGSLAVGLAAQETISNMISGFVIMLDRPFRKGDRVKIPTGEEGDIFEIGLRSTRIVDADNNLLIVPNSELIKTRIVNYSFPAPAIRVIVEVTVAYGSDVAKVKKILLDLARSHSDVLKMPPPEVNLMKLDPAGIQFKLFCRVGSFSEQGPAAEKLRVQAYEALMKAKVEFAVPQQVVHIKERRR